MTNTAPTTATKRVPMDPMRKTALAGGVFYLITFTSRSRPSSCTAPC